MKKPVTSNADNTYLRISETRVEIRIPLEGFNDYTYKCLKLSEYPSLTLYQLIELARKLRDGLIDEYGLYQTKKSNEEYIGKLINGYMVAVRVKPKKRITKMFAHSEYGDRALAEAKEFRDMLVLFKAGFAEQAQRKFSQDCLKVKGKK